MPSSLAAKSHPCNKATWSTSLLDFLIPRCQLTPYEAFQVSPACAAIPRHTARSIIISNSSAIASPPASTEQPAIAPSPPGAKPLGLPW
jgi:hypothetical protein